MPTHDPSTCLLCRWLGAREGYEYKDTGWLPRKSSPQWRRRYHPFEESAYGYHRYLPSYCTSLDAVEGLRKELNEKVNENAGSHYWNHSWWPVSKIWVYEAPGSGLRRFESPEDLPAACVIAAAMQVLGDKESDD